MPAQTADRSALESRIPLAEIALFRELPDEVLARIEARSQLRHFRVGDLVCDGAPDHGVCAILDGQVAVTRAGNPTGGVLLAEVRAGECVGEFIAVAGVRATAPTVALEIPQSAFRQLIESHPQVLLRLAAHLVAIIRRLNERLAELGSFDEEVRRIHQELFLITL
jgi:CRP-like cAMP-binding protein